MRRIAVTGPAGAGKSRLASELGRILDLPVLHLDALYWGAGWVQPPQAEWEATQRRELAGESWVVEAQYDDMLPEWVDAADTVVVVDASPLRCLWRVSRRRLDSGPAPGVPVDSPPGPVHRALRKFARGQWEYRRNVRPALLAHLARLGGDRRVVMLRRGRDVGRFLATL
jgi:hypothetical protein